MTEKQYLERMYKEINSILGGCLRIRKELEAFPKGCLSRKKINGKEYYYMQQRVGSKIETKFIPAANVDELRKQVEIRDKKRKELDEFEELARKIAKSSKAFEPSFYADLKDLINDYRMEVLTKQEKEEIVNAEKAISLSEWREEELSKTDRIDELWINGVISYREWRMKLDEIYK